MLPALRARAFLARSLSDLLPPSSCGGSPASHWVGVETLQIGGVGFLGGFFGGITGILLDWD
jgi:hypothetical protein